MSELSLLKSVKGPGRGAFNQLSRKPQASGIRVNRIMSVTILCLGFFALIVFIVEAIVGIAAGRYWPFCRALTGCVFYALYVFESLHVIPAMLGRHRQAIAKPPQGRCRAIA